MSFYNVLWRNLLLLCVLLVPAAMADNEGMDMESEESITLSHRRSLQAHRRSVCSFIGTCAECFANPECNAWIPMSLSEPCRAHDCTGMESPALVAPVCYVRRSGQCPMDDVGRANVETPPEPKTCMPYPKCKGAACLSDGPGLVNTDHACCPNQWSDALQNTFDGCFMVNKYDCQTLCRVVSGVTMCNWCQVTPKLKLGG
eukprot:g2653.t1